MSDLFFTCGTEVLTYVQTYKYLGLWFHENLNMNFTVKELSKSAGRALSGLYSKFINAGGMTHSVFTKLFLHL